MFHASPARLFCDLQRKHAMTESIGLGTHNRSNPTVFIRQVGRNVGTTRQMRYRHCASETNAAAAENTVCPVIVVVS